MSDAVDEAEHRRRKRRPSRLALLAIASNTGCTSDGELAITFRISAVAVCRSSASCVSLNSRAFSMAMTAWSAKVWSSSTCFSSKGADFGAREDDHADWLYPRAAAARRSMLRQPIGSRELLGYSGSDRKRPHR